MAKLKLNPKRTALLIQDLQNDVMIEKGAFADSGAPQHAKEQNVVANVKRLATAFRKAGSPVIHVWYIVEKGAPGLKQNAPLFEGVKGANALVRGTWGAKPAAGLEPKRGDFVVEKMRMSGWQDTKLETLLRGLGVDTVVVTGVSTSGCVRATATDALTEGFRPIVVADACADRTEELHRNNLADLDAKYADVVDLEEALARLGGSTG